MTNQDLANVLNTPENRAAYSVAQDKTIFVQELIEGQNISTPPGSALCDFVEDHLSGDR